MQSFQDVHRGGKIVVCGCGVSLKLFECPERFITIGVNDVGRQFHPNYLLVVDPPARFKGDRFHYVQKSQAEYLFTQRTDLDVPHPNVVNFRLGIKGGVDFADPNVMHYGVVTPYMALYLAAHMGAVDIGMIGVDFTDHHFFGETGPHDWGNHVATIDEQFRRLGAALLRKGVRVFNLSPVSRLTAFPKMDLAAFEELTAMATNCAASESVGLSVVVVSLNEGEHLRHTIDNLTASMPAGSEIVVVDDGSADGSADFLQAGYDHVTALRSTSRLGSAQARNFGAQHARGKTLVFCDAHVAVRPGWLEPLLVALNRPDVGAVMPAMRVMRYPDDYHFPTATSEDHKEARGYGLRWRDASLGVEWLHSVGSEPYPVPLLGAACLVIHRNLFAAIGGFDPGLMIWGCEDAELSLRLWTLGYECLVVPAVEVAHLFRRVRPYRVEWEAVLYNKLRLATVHFNSERRRRVMEQLKSNGAFAAALARLESSDVEVRSSQLRAFRRYDDDWFFERFSCPV